MASRMVAGGLVLGLWCGMAWSGQAAEPPVRVLVVGDSMMRVVAHATELELSRREGMEALSHTSLGSGLARLDVFDWMAKIDELVAAFEPTVSIVWFGTNDRQPLRAGGRVIAPDSGQWEEEYARRVGDAMDRLAKVEGSRVLWLELPDMREARMQADVDLINRLVEQEAGKRSAARFVPTRTLLSRQPGTYSAYVIGPDGMPLQIRHQDGVHLNRAGADRLAAALVPWVQESESDPERP